MKKGAGTQHLELVAKEYQNSDFFMSQCDLEALIELSSLVAPTNTEDMNFIDNPKDLKTCLKQQERMVVEEPIGFLQMSQGEEEV